jgi:hypothetical protein
MAERDGGSYEIIDGLQRLHTLMSFVELGFTTEEGKYFDTARFLTADDRRKAGGFSLPEMETAEEGVAQEMELLASAEVARYLDYPLSISIMRGASTEEVDEVFARINTYGHQLSDQERRQAGVQGDFPRTVREIATELRGDVSSDVLNLSQMPMISIDLPKMKHGYSVQADQVFWVSQGVLNGGNLRDSLDEQCIADVLASIVGGKILARTKEALDKVYDKDEPESAAIGTALDSYGVEKLKDEFKFCVQELLAITAASGEEKLRKILFKGSSNNPFPNVFAVLLIAIHESLIVDQKKIADYNGVKKALLHLSDRLNSTQKGTVSDERRKNIDIIKGLIRPHLSDGANTGIYSNPTVIDIDSIIRRSMIESPRYELKQGLLNLGDQDRSLNPAVVSRVIETICGIANCGPGTGVVLVGVADKEKDAERVAQLDKIVPTRVAERHVVGVLREAAILGETAEQYVGRWKNAIRNSDLSEPLKSGVLASIDFNDYRGLGVLVLRVPSQKQLSTIGDRAYGRQGDETVELQGVTAITSAAALFA